MKLGKLPAAHDPRDLKMMNYLTGAPVLPLHPPVFGHEKLVEVWGMLGNDTVGDCVFAGGDHETMLWNAERGLQVNFTADDAISDYSAVTGYDPSDASTDQGTVTRQALNYRRKVGLRDAFGNRHRIGAYIALEPGHWGQVLEAVWLFGAVGIGVEFPGSAMAQFRTHQVWDVVRGSSIDGGHYIPLVSYRATLACVTWGRLQGMTKRWFEKYCDEAYAILSLEMLLGGKSPEGFDLNALREDLHLVAA